MYLNKFYDRDWTICSYDINMDMLFDLIYRTDDILSSTNTDLYSVSFNDLLRDLDNLYVNDVFTYRRYFVELCKIGRSNRFGDTGLYNKIIHIIKLNYTKINSLPNIELEIVENTLLYLIKLYDLLYDISPLYKDKTVDYYKKSSWDNHCAIIRDINPYKEIKIKLKRYKNNELLYMRSIHEFIHSLHINVIQKYILNIIAPPLNENNPDNTSNEPNNKLLLYKYYTDIFYGSTYLYANLDSDNNYINLLHENEDERFTLLELENNIVNILKQLSLYITYLIKILKLYNIDNLLYNFIGCTPMIIMLFENNLIRGNYVYDENLMLLKYFCLVPCIFNAQDNTFIHPFNYIYNNIIINIIYNKLDCIDDLRNLLTNDELLDVFDSLTNELKTNEKYDRDTIINKFLQNENVLNCRIGEIISTESIDSFMQYILFYNYDCFKFEKYKLSIYTNNIYKVNKLLNFDIYNNMFIINIEIYKYTLYCNRIDMFDYVLYYNPNITDYIFEYGLRYNFIARIRNAKVLHKIEDEINKNELNEYMFMLFYLIKKYYYIDVLKYIYENYLERKDVKLNNSSENDQIIEHVDKSILRTVYKCKLENEVTGGAINVMNYILLFIILLAVISIIVMVISKCYFTQKNNTITNR